MYFFLLKLATKFCIVKVSIKYRSNNNNNNKKNKKKMLFGKIRILKSRHKLLLASRECQKTNTLGKFMRLVFAKKGKKEKKKKEKRPSVVNFEWQKENAAKNKNVGKIKNNYNFRLKFTIMSL